MNKDFDELGYEISGGESQKIALARATYKNAKILILDEPTAALDPISEAEIYMQFYSASNDKTTIFVSHRLAICRLCDRIIVFDNGMIVQSGTHEKLITKKGKYLELWQAQAQYYE